MIYKQDMVLIRRKENKKMYSMNDLIQLECMMEESGCTFLEETYSTQPKIVVLMEKIIAYIKSTVLTMSNYASTIKLDIEKHVTSAKIKKTIIKLRSRLLAGETVYLPDLQTITQKYKGIVTQMRKEIGSICKQLTSVRLIGGRDRVGKYLEQRDDFDKRLGEIISELDNIGEYTIAVSASDGAAIDRYANKVIQQVNMYVTEYTKLVRDIEKIALDFQTCTQQAEITYNIQQLTKNNMSKIESIKKSATKCLRRSTFIICAAIA